MAVLHQQHGPDNTPPRFTIVVPTCGRPDQLRSCLHAIAKLDYPRDSFDVVVVDDGSEYPPEAPVAEVRPFLRIGLVSQPNAGPGVARNTGVTHASGEFVAFLGDDCEPAPDWLHALARGFSRAPDSLVGGRIVNALDRNPYSAASDRLIGFLYAHYNRDPERAQFFTPNNMAMPRSLFLTLGGFDGAMGATGEDREFCDRWRARGYPMLYAADAVVHHSHPLTLSAFWRQQMAYGRGTYRYRRRQRQPREGRLAPERLSFYFKLVRFPFSQERGGRAWLHAGLLGLSQVANAAGFFLEAAETTRLNRGKQAPSVSR